MPVGHSSVPFVPQRRRLYHTSCGGHAIYTVYSTLPDRPRPPFCPHPDRDRRHSRRYHPVGRPVSSSHRSSRHSALHVRYFPSSRLLLHAGLVEPAGELSPIHPTVHPCHSHVLHTAQHA